MYLPVATRYESNIFFKGTKTYFSTSGPTYLLGPRWLDPWQNMATRSSARNRQNQTCPITCLQVTFVTGYQEPHLPASVDQLVVDNSVFRIFQDHFVTNTMRADGTLWSLLASISEGWEAIQTTQKNALSHPRFQEFLHNPNCTWDLVIASPFINEAGVMLADHFRAPMILYLPANAGEFLSLSLGHPDSVAWSGAMAGSLGGRINTLLGHMAYELLIKPKYFVQPQAGY